MARIVDLNFKVSDGFRRLFKGYAARLGISGKELLERSVGLWELIAPDNQLSIKMLEQNRANKMIETEENYTSTIVARRVAVLQADSSIDQIATKLGYRSVDFIALLIAGEARLPLNEVKKFANVLGIDFVELAQAALNDFGLADFAEALEPQVTPEELDLIRSIRRLLKANA